MISGIYAILNIETDKFYVGQAIDLKKRWSDHTLLLGNNNHYNKHLQAAWNKQLSFGFIFVVLEYCEFDKLTECEQFWIDKTKCYDRKIGYNKRLIAESNRGIKWDHPKIVSKETRLKISQATKGRIVTEKQSIAISKANKSRIGIKYNIGVRHNTKCKCENCKFIRNELRRKTRKPEIDKRLNRHKAVSFIMVD